METIDESLDEWEYRAEGNFHIVIVNLRTRQVLRLPKCYSDQKIYDDLSSLEAASSELSFVQHVAHPAMRHCKACYPVQQVPLSKEFLRKIAEKVEPYRPNSRLHKVIDEDCKYGILMPDFCQVLPPPPCNADKTITVEIKPKQGFLLKGHKTCKFSQFQHLKVQSRAYDRESTYCPVDLFSGCRKRMQRAIKSLIQHPQNNLRIFKNGKVIYSQENINGMKSEKAKEIFRSNVLTSLASNYGDKLSATEKLKFASHDFQDILCNLLLWPVCEHKPNVIHVPQRCDRGCLGRDKDIHFLPNKLSGKVTNENRLSPDCILGLLLYLQKLEDRSISEYYKMYNSMNKHLSSQPDDAERLSLGSPYDAVHWRQVVTEICEKEPVMQSAAGEDGNEGSWMEDIDQVADVLRKFLIATSFKDCSIMMTFHHKDADTEIARNNQELPITLKTRSGQEYWASLALVDSDPKPASRIPQYFCNANKHS